MDKILACLLSTAVFLISGRIKAETAPLTAQSVFYVRAHLLMGLGMSNLNMVMGDFDWRSLKGGFGEKQYAPPALALEPGALVKISACAPVARSDEKDHEAFYGMKTERECKAASDLAGECESSGSNFYQLRLPENDFACDGEVLEGHAKGKAVVLRGQLPRYKNKSLNHLPTLEQFQSAFGMYASVGIEPPVNEEFLAKSDLEAGAPLKIRFNKKVRIGQGKSFSPKLRAHGKLDATMLARHEFCYLEAGTDRPDHEGDIETGATYDVTDCDERINSGWTSGIASPTECEKMAALSGHCLPSTDDKKGDFSWHYFSLSLRCEVKQSAPSVYGEGRPLKLSCSKLLTKKSGRDVVPRFSVREILKYFSPELVQVSP